MKRVAIILGLIFLLPHLGKADIIFFKDGMKTVCQEKAWEEGQEVKCEYEGTVLSYQKKDVLRIEQIRTEEKEPPAEAEKTSEQPPAAVPCCAVQKVAAIGPVEAPWLPPTTRRFLPGGV